MSVCLSVVVVDVAMATYMPVFPAQFSLNFFCTRREKLTIHFMHAGFPRLILPSTCSDNTREKGLARGLARAPPLPSGMKGWGSH